MDMELLCWIMDPSGSDENGYLCMDLCMFV